ncbi:MAG TPA: DinB family protein, partial [Verrucomicrobiae bacterium]|nr:DinB family protein [Verrucomicrobiae bacterium]
MRSIEEWRQAPRAERLARLALTGDELARAIAGQDPQRLTRRPDPVNWAPVEVLCHLRDTEESFLHRFRLVLIMDEPRFPSTNPNRWAAERQYLRNDSAQALAAFTRGR